MINIDSTLKYIHLWKIKMKKCGQLQFQIKNAKTKTSILLLFQTIFININSSFKCTQWSH